MLMVVSLLGVGPMSAQAFEGVISTKLSPESDVVEANMSVKGPMMATTVTMPSGPMAGQEARMIMNNSTGKMTMLLQLPAGMGNIPGMAGGKGIKMVIDVKAEAAKYANEPGELKKLATTQKIAGHSCDDYELVTKGKKSTFMCVTDDLGAFSLPSMGGGRNSPSDWSRILQAKSLFPLKVWTSPDKALFEVTAIQRKSIPASTFVIPEGYNDMSGMMGGMGRRP